LYYALLEREKHNSKVGFLEVIRKLYDLTGRVEPSFSSKIVATIRPGLPVYDAHVVKHMKVEVPPQTAAKAERITKLAAQYERMTEIAAALVKTDEFRKLQATFDKDFPDYKHFTGTKKLDLMLWQMR